MTLGGAEEARIRLAVENQQAAEQQLSRFFENLNAYLDHLVKKAQEVNKATSDMAEGMAKPAGGADQLSAKTIALGVALGNFATKVLTSVINGLVQLGRTMIEVGQIAFGFAADFEKTQTAFRAMVGNAQIADGFLQELTEFSRTTPFAIQEIEQLSRQMLGMGFAIGDILPNMRMLLDVAAGTDAPLSRIVFNYAQILAQNQAYTLDLKQFAQAGIPIYEELAKVLGVSVEEVRKLVQESKVGFEEVRAAFESMTSEGGRFNGITQQLAQTSRGVAQLIRNEFVIVSRVVAGPVVESFKTAQLAVLDLVTSLGPGGELQNVTAAVAATAAIMAEGFGNFVQFAVNAVKSFGPRMENEIFPTIRNALVWGAEFSANFAKGMIEGAVAALTVAVRFITGLLSFWFAPGSPPRVAPNIDNWGADAFTEYLKGFTRADFGILKSLQGPIKSALDIIKRSMELSLAPDDKGASQKLVADLTKNYTDLSIAIAGAIRQARETGVINEAVLNQVANATGRYGQEVASLLRLELQLSAALKDVAAATEQVTNAEAAQKAARDALKGVQDQMQQAREEVQRLQEELFLLHKYDIGGEITITTAEQLQAARARLAALQGEEDAARGVVDETQSQLDAAQEVLAAQQSIADAIGEQVALQKDFLSQVLSLQEMQFDPLKSLVEATKKGVGDMTDAFKELADIPTQIDWGAMDMGFSSAFESAKQNILSAINDMKRPFLEAWNELIAGSSFDTAPTTVEMTSGRFETRKGPIAQLQEALDNLSKLDLSPVTNALSTIQSILDSPAFQAGAGWALGFIATGKLIYDLILNPIYGILVAIGNNAAFKWFIGLLSFDKISAGLFDVAGWIDKIWAGFVGLLSVIGTAVTAVLGFFGIVVTLPAWLVGLITVAVVAAVAAIILHWDKVVEWFKNMADRIADFLNKAIAKVEEKFFKPLREAFNKFVREDLSKWRDDFVVKVGELSDKLKTKAQEIWDNFSAKIKEGLDNFVNNTIPAFVSNVITAFGKINLWNTGRNIIQGLWDGMTSLWSSVTGWIGAAISGLISTTNKQAGVKSPSWKTEETGMYLMLGLEKGIKEYGQLAITAASSVTRQINAASVLGSARGGDVSNVVNYNVNANYQERQSPARIADDLALLSALQG